MRHVVEGEKKTEEKETHYNYCSKANTPEVSLKSRI